MKYPDSQGNKMFLFCSGCELFPFELGRRQENEYQAAKMIMDLGKWFEDHARCPNGPDKFKLAHQYSCNHDVAKPADPVANAVRLALVKS